MLWQRSPSPPEGHQVPGWGEEAQELGDWELPAHFWGENTSGQGGVLPWPQAHSQALAHRPVIGPAGQPASPMRGKTPSNCLHRAGSKACTALPCLPMAAGQWAMCRTHFFWSQGHAAPTLGQAPCLWTGCTMLHRAGCWGTDRLWPYKNSPRCP